MSASTPAGSGIDPLTGRPTEHLPTRQLLRISFYWLGLSSIFAGLTFILINRLEFGDLGLGLVGDQAGETLANLTVMGAVIAILVQPTIGAISDYTVTRWGRRKPYILIGTILDVVFLIGIAASSDLIAVAAFIALLQFSSNFAQGPFQGYVPDLVPQQQVGVASALVGLMQVLGNVAGFVIAGLAVAADQLALGLIALGLLELVTMLSVVIRVRDTRPAKPRGGRSWLGIAKGAWGVDILRERSFMWLLGSRLTILMAGSILTTLGAFYLIRSLRYSQAIEGLAIMPVVGLVALGTILSVLPAARLSDRIGRKKVIYASTAIGAVGLALVAIGPSLWGTPASVLSPSDDVVEQIGVVLSDRRYLLALAGAVTYGISAGTFLAVDWALITDIIPKASSGRYMGISNVATASSGVLALVVGGRLMDAIGAELGKPSGPVAAMWLAVILMGVGAVLLVPVVEPKRGTADTNA